MNEDRIYICSYLKEAQVELDVLYFMESFKTKVSSRHIIYTLQPVLIIGGKGLCKELRFISHLVIANSSLQYALKLPTLLFAAMFCRQPIIKILINGFENNSCMGNCHVMAKFIPSLKRGLFYVSPCLEPLTVFNYEAEGRIGYISHLKMTKKEFARGSFRLLE